jgi:hypothetical protein
MSWLIGILLLALAGTSGAVIIYHRNLRQPVSWFWVDGLIRIGAGLVLIAIAAFRFFGGEPGDTVTAVHSGEAKAAHHIAEPASIAAMSGFVQNPPGLETTHRATPRAATTAKPATTRHLGLSLDHLKQRLGPGRWTMSSATIVRDPKQPTKSRQLGSAWRWDEGDYNLTCVFGPDGICHEVTFYRSLGFNRDQAVTIIRGEIGDERPVPIAGRSHESVTRDGIIVRASRDASSISFEAPELALLRVAAIAEMEAERKKPIHVR